MGYDTILQIEIDQVLVGDPRLLRKTLEVGNAILIQTNRNLLLQPLGVGIFNGFGKIRILASYYAMKNLLHLISSTGSICLKCLTVRTYRVLPRIL
jgi:hypothetical protein